MLRMFPAGMSTEPVVMLRMKSAASNTVEQTANNPSLVMVVMILWLTSCQVYNVAPHVLHLNREGLITLAAFGLVHYLSNLKKYFGSPIIVAISGWKANMKSLSRR